MTRYTTLYESIVDVVRRLEHDDLRKLEEQLVAVDERLTACEQKAIVRINQLEGVIAQQDGLATAARNLLAYRDGAGPVGFQLVKMDDYLEALREALDESPAE
jgi:hypothetical protein